MNQSNQTLFLAFIIVSIFILGSSRAQALGVQAVPSDVEVIVQPALASSKSITNEIIKNQPSATLVDYPPLNKLSELLVLAELEGMQKSWFLTSSKADQLNQLAQQNNLLLIRSEVASIASNLIHSLIHGQITPDKIGEKTNIKPKKTNDALIKTEIEKFESGVTTAQNLFSLFRPKNTNYLKLLQAYRKIITAQVNAQIMKTPAILGTIKAGSKDKDSILFARQRLALFGYENDVLNPEYTEDLNLAIQELQENNLLKRDGVIGTSSWGLLNTGIDQIVTRIKINLDRSRWLPDDLQTEYVHINLAAQRLFYYKNNVITMTFRTINGRPERPTPIMLDAINHMRLNPTWTVPRTIYFQDKGPLFAKDPGQAALGRFRFYDLRTNPSTEVRVTDINWAEETSKDRENSNASMNYRIVQSPGGDKNALGWIKFPLLKNSLSIYLHDTNEREKFAQTNRMLSSGCIRMEKPFELAEKLLSGQVDATTGFPVHTVETLKAETENLLPVAERESVRSLGRTVPVYVLYETTHINDKGQMTLVADNYGVDMDMYNLMTGVSISTSSTSQ